MKMGEELTAGAREERTRTCAKDMALERGGGRNKEAVGALGQILRSPEGSGFISSFLPR